jgi:hypothetical protein
MMREHDALILEEILAAKRKLRDDPKRVVGRDDILRWAKSEDVDAQGALYYLLFDGALGAQIAPSLTLEDVLDFALPYLERCLRKDPQSDWTTPRWSAGWDVTNWIKSLWEEASSRPWVDRFPDWLALIYKTGDDDLRTCIVQAILEHLFEVEGIAEKFASWHDDPGLRPAYEEAKLWKEGLDELALQST